MRIHGRVTHSVCVPLAGQKKATRGKAGFSRVVVASIVIVPLELLGLADLFFLGRWEDAIVIETRLRPGRMLSPHGLVFVHQSEVRYLYSLEA
jgi:hypothetical protein